MTEETFITEEYERMSARERNNEFKRLLTSFPATPGIDFGNPIPSNLVDPQTGERLVYLDSSTAYKRSGEGNEIKGILFSRLQALFSHVQATPTGKMFLLGELNYAYETGIVRNDTGKPIEQVLKDNHLVGEYLSIAVDADNPESEGMFSKEGGSRIEKKLFREHKKHVKDIVRDHIDTEAEKHGGINRFLHRILLRGRAMRGKLTIDGGETSLDKRWERDLRSR